MSKFKLDMQTLQLEKEYYIKIGWKDKAQQINEKMVKLIDEQTQKEKSLINA